MDRRMRAAYFTAPREITIGEAPVPEPGPGEIRLRVRYCGICGSDLSVYKTGVFAGPDTVLGHEVSGVVDLDPSGELPTGTRVAPYPGGGGCGECVWCREGKVRYCLNQDDRHGGGFAEYTVVASEDVITVPDDLDDRAAAVAEPLGVSLRGVELAEAKPGDLAYVAGLGSVGLLAVAGLLAAGCRVIGADPREDRRALGAELGCEEVFDNTARDPGTVLSDIDPHGPRIVLECSGVPDSLQQVFDACGHQGVVGIIGIPMAPVFLLRMTLRELRAFSIQGPSRDSMRRALDLLRERPTIAETLTTVVPLDAVDEAFEALVEGRGGVKVLVAPDGNDVRSSG